jgi:pseudouridylate synthase / pseudouridine kinase
MAPSSISYISPNLLELEQLYTAIESQMEVNSSMRDWWWSIIDDLELNQSYHSQLAILSRQPIHGNLTGEINDTLGFLTEAGVARMAVQLLPFFQHLFIKCGKAGAHRLNFCNIVQV